LSENKKEKTQKGQQKKIEKLMNTIIKQNKDAFKELAKK